MKILAVVVSLALVAGGGWYFLGEKFARAGGRESGGIEWVPFSARELSALQTSGKSIFVDFTADWCITCKFNERTAIATPAVRQLLREKSFAPLGGLVGVPLVNVLEINLALRDRYGKGA